MNIKKLEWAEAFLIGNQGALDSIDAPSNLYRFEFGKTLSFDVFPTMAGYNVIVPRFKDSYTGYRKLYLGEYIFEWPILPMVRHRGGFCTATARYYMETNSWWGYYDDPYGNTVFSKGEQKYPRTQHRVFWCNRRPRRIVVDVIRKPRDDT